MKRIGTVLVLVALFAGSYAWFSRRESPPAPPPVRSPEPSLRTKHEAMFGAAANQSDVKWRESGFGYRIANEGSGPKPGIGATVRIVYTGRLKDGTVFDSSAKPVRFVIGGTIPGLSIGLQMLGTGGKGVFFIPPSLGYGRNRVAGIPGDSGLIFDVQLVSIEQ